MNQTPATGQLTVTFDDADHARETLLALRERAYRVRCEAQTQTSDVFFVISRRQLDRMEAAAAALRDALRE